MLKWIWRYSNNHHVAKAEYEGRSYSLLWTRKLANAIMALHPQSKVYTKPKSKRPRVEKPLLHCVLRIAGLKALHEYKAKPSRTTSITEEADDMMIDEKLSRHRALQPADPNCKVGESGQIENKLDHPSVGGFDVDGVATEGLSVVDHIS